MRKETKASEVRDDDESLQILKLIRTKAAETLARQSLSPFVLSLVKPFGKFEVFVAEAFVAWLRRLQTLYHQIHDEFLRNCRSKL